LLKRLGLMTTVVTLALTLAACGRATEDQINQALGITPTPTMSAGQMAESTAAANATSTAKELALASPGATGGAVAGDVTAGKRQFDYWCIACHGPGGSGPDILAAGSPGSSVDPATLLAMIREGEGHTPPGPYKPTELSDKQVTDVAAYLHSAPGN
jgi:mono/diheme cytochrome c family protein